jgi:transposase InsO family protein
VGNGYCESFNSKLRDELLAGEQFSTLHEAKVLIEQWRRHYNAIRPYSSLGYRAPARCLACRPPNFRITLHLAESVTRAGGVLI